MAIASATIHADYRPSPCPVRAADACRPGNANPAMPDIIERNQLTLTGNGLWVLPESSRKPFDYSDGESVENYLREVLERSEDLSSRSPSLQTAIRDWPTEYHLSSDRATLLRPYNLGGVETVLEL